jgi:hypothetical protein
VQTTGPRMDASGCPQEMGIGSTPNVPVCDVKET